MLSASGRADMQTPAQPEAAGSGSGSISTERSQTGSPPQRTQRRGLWLLWLLWLLVGLLGVLALLYAAAFAYQFVETQLRPFAPLAALLVLGLLLRTVGPWLLVRERQPLEAALSNTAHWLWDRLLARRVPQRFEARFPRLARFLRGRVARTPTGLALTLGLIAAGALAWTVLELSFEVITGSPTVGDDHRVLNLVATLRTPSLDQVLYGVTLLGNAQTLVVLTAVAALVALVAGRPRDAVLLVLAVLAGTLFFELVKLAVQRPRPPLEDARIVQGGFSFPSGHSTLAATVYGTVAYLLIRGIRQDPGKGVVGSAGALAGLAVG